MKLKVLSLLLCLSAFHSVFAQDKFFGIDDLLGPFPAIGSVAEKNDIDQLLYFQNARTPEQCAAAESEANASLEAFFGGTHQLLSRAEINKVTKKLRLLTIKTGAKILYYKTKYDRSRPYVNHPEIKPCIDLETSHSYPSGHATLARVYARVLAVIYPERSAQFLQRADEVALNRVLGGVHHPSDIAAGKKLGDAIADDYLESGDSFYQVKILNDAYGMTE